MRLVNPLITSSAVLCAIALSACGSSENTYTAASTTPTIEKTPAAKAEESAKKKYGTDSFDPRKYDIDQSKKSKTTSDGASASGSSGSLDASGYGAPSGGTNVDLTGLSADAKDVVREAVSTADKTIKKVQKARSKVKIPKVDVDGVTPRIPKDLQDDIAGAQDLLKSLPNGTSSLDSSIKQLLAQLAEISKSFPK